MAVKVSIPLMEFWQLSQNNVMYETTVRGIQLAMNMVVMIQKDLTTLATFLCPRNTLGCGAPVASVFCIHLEINK